MPTTSVEKKLINNLMIIYGIRDISMGLSVYATVYFGSRKALGWNLSQQVLLSWEMAWCAGQKKRVNGITGAMRLWDWFLVLY
ncbi:hypothetical protein BT63DRAFT_421218 [Microthyrium microscopicum]|uniref:Uncharacterized protein n=1 Tax=Microthyrium microscopicum TaxID=703497 RepID=A0A6A6UL55_9PEZI|nr:hypothetical protein BT63DRAFT_421218 [Microthyrium microscopicum]